MAFCIMTDSASDIPASIKNEYGIKVMGTPVVIDGVDYFDGETIFPDEFYKIQAEGVKEISTYHVSQFMFEEAFREFAERGDEVLYICFSTGIAGTFQAANLAKEAVIEEYPDFKITIIDSKCASLGYGLVVERLLTMQKNGAPKELIIEAAEFFCAHMKHYVTVETLEYLFKGGRISRGSAVAGGVLDIKPIIIVDENGSLKSADKVRGWKKAQNKILDLTAETIAEPKKQVVGVVYGKAEDAEYIISELKDTLKVKGVLSGQLGCAIGAHIGPKTLGIVSMDAWEPKFEEYLK